MALAKEGTITLRRGRETALSQHDPQAAEQGLQKEEEKKQTSLETGGANLQHVIATARWSL